jgi:hypothetical protein
LIAELKDLSQLTAIKSKPFNKSLESVGGVVGRIVSGFIKGILFGDEGECKLAERFPLIEVALFSKVPYRILRFRELDCQPFLKGKQCRSL